jgi:DNA processing protein
MDLIRSGRTASEAVEYLAAHHPHVLRNDRMNFDAEKEIKRCQEMGVRVMVFSDADYPEMLRHIYDPPPVLYVAGDLIAEDGAAIAVVGTRHPGLYGLTQTKRFVRRLSEKGLTIVSGFAKGIDRAAHEAALEVPYGRTLAVLGCGVDVDYPRDSRKLFEKIGRRGAVISEYSLGTPPLAENFPRRNRIISGLSLGVLVMEAHARSGSIITAHEAAEQGREVFAVPGPVDQLTSRGTHQLIREGAVLAECPEDIFELLGTALSVNRQRGLGQEPKRDFSGVLPLALDSKKDSFLEADAGNMGSELLERLHAGPSSVGVNEFLNWSGLDAAAAVASLTRLELQNKIKKGVSGRFEVCK